MTSASAIDRRGGAGSRSTARGRVVSSAGRPRLGCRRAASRRATSPAIAGAGRADQQRPGQPEQLDQDEAGHERPDDRPDGVRRVQPAEGAQSGVRGDMADEAGNVAPIRIVAGARARTASDQARERSNGVASSAG